jgi:hypothetical protein
MKLIPSRKQFGYGHLKQMEKEGDVAGLVEALDAPRVKRSKSRRAAVATAHLTAAGSGAFACTP